MRAVGGVVAALSVADQGQSGASVESATREADLEQEPHLRDRQRRGPAPEVAA